MPRYELTYTRDGKEVAKATVPDLVEGALTKGQLLQVLYRTLKLNVTKPEPKTEATEPQPK